MWCVLKSARCSRWRLRDPPTGYLRLIRTRPRLSHLQSYHLGFIAAVLLFHIYSGAPLSSHRERPPQLSLVVCSTRWRILWLNLEAPAPGLSSSRPPQYGLLVHLCIFTHDPLDRCPGLCDVRLSSRSCRVGCACWSSRRCAVLLDLGIRPDVDTCHLEYWKPARGRRHHTLCWIIGSPF